MNDHGESRPTVARYILASEEQQPALTLALRVAELVHSALVALSDGHPVFTGRQGESMRIGHQHGFILPEANAESEHLSHITIYSPQGFDGPAVEALKRLQRVWGDRIQPLHLVRIGIGGRRAFAGDDLEAGQCPLLGSSLIWTSRTPFVATRHPKSFRDGRPKLDADGLQIGGPEHDLLRLARETGLPSPVRVEAVGTTDVGGQPVDWSEFIRTRANGVGRRASSQGHGYRLTFSEPVEGPLAFGYGAHFGLGLFAPDGVFG